MPIPDPDMVATTAEALFANGETATSIAIFLGASSVSGMTQWISGFQAHLEGFPRRKHEVRIEDRFWNEGWDYGRARASRGSAVPWLEPISIPSCAWEDYREAIEGRWPISLVVLDLRFWTEQEAQGNPRPSGLTLAKTWGWSSSAASRFIRNEPWMDAGWMPKTRRRT